jgi:hypothetical protein
LLRIYHAPTRLPGCGSARSPWAARPAPGCGRRTRRA